MTMRLVPRDEAAEVRSRATTAPDPDGPLAALLSGEMVHFTDDRAHFNRHRLAKQGWRLRTSRGDGGRYWWVEAIE